MYSQRRTTRLIIYKSLQTRTHPKLPPKDQHTAFRGASPPPIFRRQRSECSILGTACTLRAAIISWNVIDTNPDQPFAALQRSSHGTLNLLSCQRRGWNLDLIDSASIHLPDVVSLHISNILLVDANPTEAYLQAIRSILPRFTRLQRFNINCVDYWEMGDISCRPDEDFNTVTEWGNACPSLTEITLPHSETSLNGAAWLSDAIKSKQHHKWDTIAESIEDAILDTTAAPPDFTETIASARSRLEDLIRTETKISLLRLESQKAHAKGVKNRFNLTSV
ncbi:hypothetical protein BJ912DRAFT_926152 [Pholiota molesta]|nr:hypothetical protein BJ912DRAFT_926152 [Pholiota molesta]